MRKERRNTHRERFPDAGAGSFLVTVNGIDYAVKALVDASTAGIGLKVGVFLDPGRPASVRLTGPEGDLTATGTVTWCERDPDGSHRIGIVFDSPHQPQSRQFFRTVKALLDAAK